MVPAYNPSGLLEQALRSVLDQDPGPEAMQIAVVDDASPGADRADELVRRLAPGRVELHRAAENLGLAGSWNRCIGLARGRWVHLLHQDDWVLPGFYERLGRAEAEAPEVGAAYCRHAIADADGHWFHLSPLERRDAGPADGLLGRLSELQRIQCAAIVVRRSTGSHHALRIPGVSSGTWRQDFPHCRGTRRSIELDEALNIGARYG
jgi:glycosyltransferase involved in cell wall biosynthesis